MTTLRKEQAQASLDAQVGRRVHHMMWDAKMTQTALGKVLGMDQSSLAKRLRGDRRWDLDEVAAVAAAFNTSMAYLVGETSDPKAPAGEFPPGPDVVHPPGLEPGTH